MHTGNPGRFENLIFVTCSKKLSDNIGKSETQEVLAYLNSFSNIQLLDLDLFSEAIDAAAIVRKSYKPDTKGVVIIGGYDVIPSLQLNILSDSLLKKIDADPDKSYGWDVDDFIVWSDDIYGDRDGDLLPEYPVSRIPDGKNAKLVMNALKAPPYRVKHRYGLRNIKRPFAEEVFDLVPFNMANLLQVSEEISPKLVKKDSIQDAIYFMLHGHDYDATRFTGELGTKNGYYEAFDVYNVPSSCEGTVVFSGCCYGALIALPKADRKEPGVQIRSRTAEQSIALSFLMAGSVCFVGCTGAHYSPRQKEENFFGKPMHISFWKHIKAGKPPAEALFEAKKEYAEQMPHGLTKPIFEAIEVKILHQFTCLGIGW